jgi:UDP-GlcNAc:undecaprenyl-phosphate GlcNAc-1-phosphate transferase
MNYEHMIYSGAAMIFAFLIAFTATPVVRVLAYKINAIDVPRDDRRMHSVPIPRLGGLAIFIGFVVSTLIFSEYTPALTAIWFGGLVLVATGIIDDVFRIGPFIKFAIQLAVAFIAVSQGLIINFINLFGVYIEFGAWSIPITVLWIIGLTNAINLIDGLDGLSCGVSVICSAVLLVVTILTESGMAVSLVTAVLVGACSGFLPFNSNPAKIFMGDTGALFLGYTFALLSIDGVFKFHTLMSFMVPISIFGLPLFDTAFSFIRRLLHGKNPFKGDRGHLHHRLIDMGFNQKQSVRILYAICGVLGLSAITLSIGSWVKSIAVIIIGFGVYLINYFIVRNPKTRAQAGLDLPALHSPDEDDTPHE